MKDLSYCSRRPKLKTALLAFGVSLLALFVVQIAIAGPAPVEVYYVPMPEAQVLTILDAIESTAAAPVQTFVSIAIAADGTLIYYDQWEDGSYDPDIANPVNIYSAGNPSGTQIWGDGNAANGAPPNFPADLLSAGDIIVLDNSVPIPRVASDLRFDGGDKLAATFPIAMTRAGWASESGTLFAGAVEMYDTSKWGTIFVTPVGEDTFAGTNDMFEHTEVLVMAAQDDTDVWVNGVFVITLDEGQSYTRRVNVGDRITASGIVQVNMIAGDVGDTYESRWYTLTPLESWDDSYYTPVSSSNLAGGTNPTDVFIYNPDLSAALTVQYETSDGGTGSLVIPANTTAQYTMLIDAGAHFYTTDGRVFYGIATVDSDGFNYDWGFSLVPESALTPQVLIGWGPGADDFNGDGTPDANMSPVWVSAVTSTTIYVDYDGIGGYCDGNGGADGFDLEIVATPLQSIKIYDPDLDATGMRVFTCDETNIAAAWGQDPSTGNPGTPALDLGTTIPPLRVVVSNKEAALLVDQDFDGKYDPGDSILYTIRVVNPSPIAIPEVVISDTVPDNVAYVPGSTVIYTPTMTLVADDTVGATVFPLDEGGINLGGLDARTTYSITFRVVINDPLPPGVGHIFNAATINGIEEVLTPTIDILIQNPSIDLEKATNGEDADVPTGPEVTVGDTVTWTYVITNDGTDALVDIVVVDDNGTPDDPADDFSPTDADCDAPLAGPLAPGDLITCRVTGTAVSGQYGNRAVVTAVSVEGEEPVEDEDLSHYFGLDPEIVLLKLVSQETVVQGKPFTYTLRITNTGNVLLDPVVLTDTLPSDILYVEDSGSPVEPDTVIEPLLVWQDLGALAPNASIVVSFRVTATTAATGTLMNYASVEGLYPGGSVTDQAQVPVTVVGPPDVPDIPSAVDLRYFRAVPMESGMRLEWATAVEVNNFGFRMLRSTSSDVNRAAELAFVPTLCRGNLCGAEYIYWDASAASTERYWYWLVDVDTSGVETLHGPVSGSPGVTALQHRLYMPMVMTP